MSNKLEENKIYNYFSKIKKEFRIIFIGRPFELKKLVFNENVIISSEQEAKEIIKAYQFFKGYQYRGLLLSIFSSVCFHIINRKHNNKKLKLSLFFFAFLPYAYSYYKSHFIYWDSIRELVIKTREREKQYLHLTNETKDIYLLEINKSRDWHKYIQKNINKLDCLLWTFIPEK